MTTNLTDTANKAAKTDVPPAQIQFRTSGQAGYTAVPPVTMREAPKPVTHRTDNCRFKPSGC